MLSVNFFSFCKLCLLFFYSRSSLFGQQPASATTTTAASSGLFGGGSEGLFGLGGKPSAENASKNVFGNTKSFGGASQSNTSCMFISMYLAYKLFSLSPKYKTFIVCHISNIYKYILKHYLDLDKERALLDRQELVVPQAGHLVEEVVT